MKGRIVQISVSPGGVPKTAVVSARVGALGLEGDGHRDYSRVSHRRHPGWSRVYARVLVGGSIRQGGPARLLSDAEAARLMTPARP